MEKYKTAYQFLSYCHENKCTQSLLKQFATNEQIDYLNDTYQKFMENKEKSKKDIDIILGDIWNNTDNLIEQIIKHALGIIDGCKLEILDDEHDPKNNNSFSPDDDLSNLECKNIEKYLLQFVKPDESKLKIDNVMRKIYLNINVFSILRHASKLKTFIKIPVNNNNENESEVDNDASNKVPKIDIENNSENEENKNDNDVSNEDESEKNKNVSENEENGTDTLNEDESNDAEHKTKNDSENDDSNKDDDDENNKSDADADNDANNDSKNKKKKGFKLLSKKAKNKEKTSEKKAKNKLKNKSKNKKSKK